LRERDIMKKLDLKDPTGIQPNPISWLLLHKDRYKIDETYQRAPGIWTKSMEQYLIDTILRGFPIPLIVVHERGRKEYIVDGQQRIYTIKRFHNCEFELSQKYSKDIISEAGGSTYSTISKEYQRRFDSYPLPILTLRDYNDEEIRSTFRRLQSGKTLTPGEKLNAFPGEIVHAMRELGSHKFFHDIIDMGVQRYKNYKLAATFLMLEENGMTSISPEYIFEFFDDNVDLDSGSATYRKVRRVMNYLTKTLKSRTGELGTQAWVMSAYLLTSYLLDYYVMKGRHADLRTFLIDFFSKVENAEVSGIVELIKFKQAISRGTNNEETINFRHEIIARRFLKKFNPPRLDEDRLFANKERLAIFRRDGGECGMCHKKLVYGKATTHYHHTTPYSVGGRTSTENGVLLCKACHLGKVHKEGKL